MNNDDIKRELAQAYQILSHLGLDDHTYTHLSARAAEGDAFYIYPFGLRYDEVTPENLMKVLFDGTVVEGQESQYNQTGYVIHGSLYQVRPDIKAMIHTHTPATVAVSAMEAGLMPISQWALHFYNRVGYHDYDSLALNESHGARLERDLGGQYTLLLRNHGALTCGRTMQEAMFYTYHLEKACVAQCMTLATQQKLLIPSPEVCEKSVQDLLTFEADLGRRDWNAWVRLLKQKSDH